MVPVLCSAAGERTEGHPWFPSVTSVPLPFSPGGASRTSQLPELPLGYTLAEKIIGAHAGRPATAGEVVVAHVDFAMIHDARAGNALKQLEKLGAKALPYATRTAFVLDHYSPPPNPRLTAGKSDEKE